MIEKSTTRYLIVAEIKTKGFVLKLYKNLADAKKNMEKTYALSLKYAFNEMYKIEKELDYFASYEIKGNVLYLSNPIYGYSNGHYSVSVIKINLNHFCLKTFIRERENHSDVFDDCSDDRLDKLCELFPNIDLIAN